MKTFLKAFKSPLLLAIVFALLLAGGASVFVGHSATYTDFVDGTYKNPLVSVNADRMYILRGKVDFAHQNMNAGDADVIQALDIPAGAHVLKVWIVTLTRTGDSSGNQTNVSLDLGYGSDVDYWGDGLYVSTPDASYTATTLTDDQSSVPLYFSAGDTIDVKATTNGADVDFTAGEIQVCALVFIP